MPLLSEFREFLRTEKRTWLTPIILVVLLVVAFFVLLRWQTLAPFIYQRF